MNSQKNNSCVQESVFAEPLSVRLERLYSACNKVCYIHPDPLERVLPYSDKGDREIVALIASSLAYGRVGQILKSIDGVLEIMGDSPYRYIQRTPASGFQRDFVRFKHRFHTGTDLMYLLNGIKQAIQDYGSLENCFLSGFSPDDASILPAAERFTETLCEFFPTGESTLLPSPKRGSACKRLHLMLRWLVRRDDVDPGGWDGIPASKLLVPLDTHMHRLARELGLTRRNAADRKTAEEVTFAFSSFCPEDPVRYDFALTRFGIHPDFSRNPFGKQTQNREMSGKKGKK